MIDNQKKTLEHIEKYGLTVIHVMEEDGKPPFSYSVGVTKTYNKPELCVIGLKASIAEFVINEYAQLLKSGHRFYTGKMYADFLEGFSVCFEDVSTKYYDLYFGQCLLFYKNTGFQMLQMLYPTTAGTYCWDDDAPQSFINNQPILTENQKSSFHEES